MPDHESDVHTKYSKNSIEKRRALQREDTWSSPSGDELPGWCTTEQMLPRLWLKPDAVLIWQAVKQTNLNWVSSGKKERGLADGSKRVL